MSDNGRLSSLAAWRRSEGFSYIEVLVSAALLLISLLTLAGMFVAGHASVSASGKTTMGVSAARQLLEDVRRLPFDDLSNLDGFDTEDPTSLPEDGLEREIARRWRYALAGEGSGWTFTDEEQIQWPLLSDQGQQLGAVGRIEVNAVSGTVREVTISVLVPGKWRPFRLATRIRDPDG